MYIKEIEIDGFKSFAEKTTIPFLEGFTTITGPNGSGKSNIIDSVLFALGLSSSRTLRAEKLPDLINNHSKRNEASVRITFIDPRGKILNVARKIRRSANGYSGIYYLNDRTSTLGDIHEELSKYNVSPGCYNVMMQGDVTSIINTTPYERRKILDEIAGVADFDRRIEQAKKELQTVEERVEKSHIILNEIDIRLTQLEEERSIALKYQKLKEEKQKFESQVSIVRYFDIKTAVERLHESILDGNKAKKDDEEKLKSINFELENLHKNLKQVSDLVKAKGEDEQIEIKKQIEALKGVIGRKSDSISYIDKQCRENDNGVNSAKENIERLKEKIEDMNLKIESKKDQISVVESNIKKEKDELNRVLSETSNISKTANEHLEKRNMLRKQLEKLHDRENELLKEKITLEDLVSRYERELEEARNVINNTHKTKTEYLEKKNALEFEIVELTKELKDFELAQKNCLFELDKIKSEINDQNYNINLAHRKILQLEANKRASEESNFKRPVDIIMSSGLAGVHAPLAHLGQVNKKYSVALETAMGSRMAFIVVDNDDVAAAGIQILKSSGKGRATFLPLNKMMYRPKGTKLPTYTGIVDFAINLVNFDKIYEPAFYFALGDTLVVEDINIVRNLIGKFRMVCIDGSILEKSGAMTGGSIIQSTMKFTQSEDDELNLYKERLKSLESKALDLEQSKNNLELKLDRTRQDYSLVMTEINKKKFENDNLARNINELDAQFEAKTRIMNELSPKLIEDEQKLDEIKNSFENIAENIRKIEDEIRSIDKLLPQDDLNKLNEKIDHIEYEIKNYETKLGNFQNEIKAMLFDIDLNKEGIGAHEETIERRIKDNLSLNNEKENHKREIVQTEERLKALNEKIKEIGNKLVELQQERDSVSNEVMAVEKKKNQLEHKIDKLLEQIEAFKSRRKEYEPELFNIREDLIKLGYVVATLQKPDISTEEVNRSITKLQKRMEELEPVNMKALVEYDEVQARKLELKNKMDTLSSEKSQIIERMGSYEDMKFRSFMDTFNNVNENFKEIFAQLSDGIGSIVLENAENPFVGGLTIEAQPRGKKMQRLESMSGGEKSLTALAFVFSLQRYMPAPFYAFDEVDMHLDGINAEKLSQMIKLQSLNTQFIVVSLRKPMIESADRTIGVTQKNNGVTKVTGVKLHD